MVLNFIEKNIFLLKNERYFQGSKNEFRQQAWGSGSFPYRYLAVLKISRKSGADSCSTPLVGSFSPMSRNASIFFFFLTRSELAPTEHEFEVNEVFPLQKMRRNNLLEAINKAAAQADTAACDIGLPELRHFLYKCKTTAQFYEPSPTPPYKNAKDDPHLLKQYRILHHRLHAPTRPLKFLFIQEQSETMLGHVTLGYELYLALEPLVTKANVIESVNKVLKWIKKEENDLFITNPMVF